MNRSCFTPVFLLLTAALPAQARAQQGGPPAELSAIAGPAPYELARSGTGFALNMGVSVPMARRLLVLEPSLGLLFYTTEFGHHNEYLLPEITLQVQGRLGQARPYLGAGLGTGTPSLSGPTHWKPTLLGLAGVRVHLSGRWGVRGEVRARSIDPWSGHSFDFGFGITHASF